jgi:hypothetical protein
MIAAYREPDKKHGKAMMQAVIDSVASGVPATLTEIRKLGRTLKQPATDILALFGRPGTSNGPTEAINGRLEHLRGSALGLRNLTNYIARSLLEAGGFRPRLHTLDCDEPDNERTPRPCQMPTVRAEEEAELRGIPCAGSTTQAWYRRQRSSLGRPAGQRS